jgi:hypothetical protein
MERRVRIEYRWAEESLYTRTLTFGLRHLYKPLPNIAQLCERDSLRMDHSALGWLPYFAARSWISGVNNAFMYAQVT